RRKKRAVRASEGFGPYRFHRGQMRRSLAPQDCNVRTVRSREGAFRAVTISMHSSLALRVLLEEFLFDVLDPVHPSEEGRKSPSTIGSSRCPVSWAYNASRPPFYMARSEASSGSTPSKSR